MMDIFEKPMPLIDSKGKTTDNDTGMLRSTFFGNITKGMYNNLLFQMLTKRPSNIKRYIPVSWQMPLVGSPPNVMFGTSISDQETAKTLYPQLMTAPGRKFLSVEPQIGPIRLFQLFEEYGKVDQVIQGGESGHHRRPFDLDWAYQMKEDCREYGIPYFFKQIDKVREIPEDLMVREFPEYNLVAGADFRD
jgi:protein gp37